MNGPGPFLLYSAAILCLLARSAPLAHAGQTDLCVVCSEPQQTYICSVTTLRAMPSDKALQLYCIVKTAKDGGHRSCSISRDTGVACDGKIMSYSYDGPAIPDALRSAAQPQPFGQPPERLATTPEAPPRQPGEPETLVEMTSRAVKAGKAGAKATGGAIVNAASRPAKTIGKIGKTAGKGVGKTARGAGSAARFAYDCVRSLFRNCKFDDKEE